MASNDKSVSRVLTRLEAEHLFNRFEEVHCFKADESGNVIAQCPGWNWELVGPPDEAGNPTKGACRYKTAAKLCTNLEAASKGTLVIEIRARNQDDERRETDIERQALTDRLKAIRSKKSELDDEILALENKIRSL